MSEQKKGLCSPRSESILSINSEGLESPRPLKPSKAEALSSSLRPNALVKKDLITGNLLVVGGLVMIESALVAVVVSSEATTW